MRKGVCLRFSCVVAGMPRHARARGALRVCCVSCAVAQRRAIISQAGEWQEAQRAHFPSSSKLHSAERVVLRVRGDLPHSEAQVHTTQRVGDAACEAGMVG